MNGAGAVPGSPSVSFAILASLAALVAVEAGCAATPAAADRPDSHDGRLERASLLLAQGHRDQAARALREQAVELESLVRSEARRPEARFWLASARYLLGDVTEALRHFEAAAALQPATSTAVALARYNLGQIHQLRGDHEAALRWFQLAADARPDDWRTNAKLVQTFQALGRTADRDRARAKVLDLFRSHRAEGVELCREQIRVGRILITAFERLEAGGEWSVRYRFELGDGALRSHSLVLGSYRITTELARRQRGVMPGERVFHLDGYGPGMEHQTFGFYHGEPSYDEARDLVVQIATSDRRPLSGTIAPSFPVASPALPATGLLRIEKAALAIDPRSDADYVNATLAALMRLAPSVSIDPAKRITVTELVRSEGTGTVLVASLAALKKQILIAYTPDRNVSVARSWRDAVNGRGSDVFVYFNPDLDPVIPTVTARGRVVGMTGRPGFIGLGHELIHALHFATGTAVGQVGADELLRTITAPHSYKDRRGAMVTSEEDVEELDTIGIGGYGNGPTENDLRRANGLPLRGAHGLKEMGTP